MHHAITTYPALSTDEGPFAQTGHRSPGQAASHSNQAVKRRPETEKQLKNSANPNRLNTPILNASDSDKNAGSPQQSLPNSIFSITFSPALDKIQSETATKPDQDESPQVQNSSRIVGKRVHQKLYRQTKSGTEAEEPWVQKCTDPQGGLAVAEEKQNEEQRQLEAVPRNKEEK